MTAPPTPCRGVYTILIRTWPARIKETEHRAPIRPDDLRLVHVLDQPGVRVGRDQRRPGGGLGDQGVVRRDHLGAVGHVDLVAVVRRRVVAGRDHHAGRRLEVLDGKGGERRRQWAWKDPDPQPRPGGDVGDVGGEIVRSVPGVPPDHDPPTRKLGPLVDQPLRQAGRRPSHHEPVHPRRPGAERSPQPGGPERERVLETGPQLPHVPRLQERGELGSGRGVRVGRHPRFRLGGEAGRDLLPPSLHARL